MHSSLSIAPVAMVLALVLARCGSAASSEFENLRHIVIGSTCTDACDGNSTLAVGPFRTFCGIDGVTYNATVEQVTTNLCYSYCGVAVQYVGLCGCPNDCGASLGRGQCAPISQLSTTVACRCNPGYGGQDCMLVRCATANATVCSGHGTCKTTTAAAGAGSDYCACDPAFTGPHCETGVFSFTLNDPVVNSVPPLLRPNSSYVTPLLNLSVIGEVRLTLDPDDYAYLINPSTVYNVSRKAKPVTMFFQNGNTMINNVSAMLQVKGSTSRLDVKKGWKLMFSTPTDFFGYSSVGLTVGDAGGDSILKPFLTAMLGRAAGIVFPRSSLTTLWINEMFMGLYLFSEAVDDLSYLSSVFGDTNGVVVKVAYDGTLKFLGWNVSTYQEEAARTFGSEGLHFIETDEWLPYIQLVYKLSLGDDPSTVVEVDALIRQVAVEAFLVDDNHFVAGQNYYLYRDSVTLLWTVVDHNFVNALSDGAGGAAPTSVFQFPLDPALNGGNPLLTLIFNQSAAFLRYQQVLASLSSAPFVSVGAHGLAKASAELESNASRSTSLVSLYDSYGQFAYPLLVADLSQQFAFTTTPQSFLAAVVNTSERLVLRAQSVASEVTQPTTPSSMTVPKIAGIAAGSAAALVVLVVVGVRLRSPARRRAAGYQQIADSRYLL